MAMLSLEDLSGLVQRHEADLDLEINAFEVDSVSFHGEPRLMGVVNLSSDSWYRESVCLTTNSAVQRGLVLKSQGAAIVDVGAESSILDAARVDAGLQESRLLPVVSELADAEVLVSVETYLPNVAKAALDAGARIVNLTGPGHSSEIYSMVASHQAAVIICHVQGENVRTVNRLNLKSDPIPEMLEFFMCEIEKATSEGVERIFIDPGLGFYYRNLDDSNERIAFQMKVFLNSFRLRKLGWPVCHALPHAFENFGEEVRSAEPFFAVLAALGKTSLFRTHEVPRTRAVLETLGAWGS